MSNLVQYEPVKPLDQIKREKEICNSLINSGYDPCLANAVIGYMPKDVPFIYFTYPRKVNEGSLIIELGIGTTDAIHNLNASWSDQILEVIIQWLGHTPVVDGKEGTKEVKRLEAHQLPDGSFVKLEYHSVSEMGEFDGELKSISYYIPKEKFRVYGGRERQSYSIHVFRRDGDVWSIDLNYSNVTGTTILNALDQMIRFHMGEIIPMKEDYKSAFRYTQLLEPEESLMITSGKPEHVYRHMLLKQDYERFEIVESLKPIVMAMMKALAPLVIKRLAYGIGLDETGAMAVDGVLHHPEKITILDKSLSEFTREQRWKLANFVVACIRDGKFLLWAQRMTDDGQAQFVSDTASRNGYHLLNWFMRTAPASADLQEWVNNAAKVVDAIVNEQEIDSERTSTMEYERIYDGMRTSFVERFIEYIAQMYLGNTLE